MKCAQQRLRSAWLDIRPVWSESSLFTWWHVRSLATHWVHSKDCDQTGRMPRLIRIFAGRTGHFVGFVMLRLISKCPSDPSHEVWVQNQHEISHQEYEPQETGTLVTIDTHRRKSTVHGRRGLKVGPERGCHSPITKKTTIICIKTRKTLSSRKHRHIKLLRAQAIIIIRTSWKQWWQKM